MELIEKPDLRAVHYLNSIEYEAFKKDCIEDAAINGDKKPTDKDMKTWYSVLKQFCKTNIKTKGITKRIYSYSLNTPAGSGGGRLFCGGSMQGIWGVYRGLLMRSKGTDIDMSNAHPVILRWICRKHKIDCSELEYYINNRDECFAKFQSEKGVPKAAAKRMYLVATNNDKFMRNSLMKTDHFKKYEKEMKEIQKQLIAIPEYRELFETIPEYKQQKNYNGAAINRILCYYENQILQHAIHVVNGRGIEIAILMFDGLMVYGDYYEDEALLKEITEYVESQMPDLNMKWAYKEHDTSMCVPEDFDETDYTIDNQDYRFVCDDNAAADLIVKDVKDILIPSRNDGRLFLKVKNVWLCDEDAVNDFLLNLILESNICKKNDDKKYVPYAQNVKSAKNVREAAVVKIRAARADAVDIYSKFHTTTKGRLCFRDGVLDFKARRFYKWDEIDFEYYTTMMIHYDYAEYFANPDTAVVNTIKESIYDTLYGNKVETALNFLSRAVAGHCEDKNWATYVGNRNCGKGVQYDNLTQALGSYVSSFELGHLLYERASNTEEVSRKLYWLIALEFARLAISQETPPPEDKLKFNGKMMKKLAGGGDEHIARRNYDRVDTRFVIDTTFMIMGNSNLSPDIKDVMETCLEFTSVCQFKSADELQKMRDDGASDLLLQSYKVKDPAIKDKCKTDEWKKATVYLLYQHYVATAVPVRRDSNDAEMDEMSIRRRILETFDITQNQKDRIICDEVNEVIKDDKKKIRAELDSMGVVKKKSNARDDTRDKWCFVGLKFKEDNTIDAAETDGDETD